MASSKAITMGIIVGNRGFFPGHLAKSGREEIIAAFKLAGITPIVLSPDESRYGAVETYDEAQRCAELFKCHAGEIVGIVVTLPNFGEERGIVDAIRLAELHVPILVQATPDKTSKMEIADRRDSFCGKMSLCNNLMQYKAAYSLTKMHTQDPASEQFQKDLAWFSAVCVLFVG